MSKIKLCGVHRMIVQHFSRKQTSKSHEISAPYCFVRLCKRSGQWRCEPSIVGGHQGSWQWPRCSCWQVLFFGGWQLLPINPCSHGPATWAHYCIFLADAMTHWTPWPLLGHSWKLAGHYLAPACIIHEPPGDLWETPPPMKMPNALADDHTAPEMQKCDRIETIAFTSSQLGT